MMSIVFDCVSSFGDYRGNLICCALIADIAIGEGMGMLLRHQQCVLANQIKLLPLSLFCVERNWKCEFITIF